MHARLPTTQTFNRFKMRFFALLRHWPGRRLLSYRPCRAPATLGHPLRAPNPPSYFQCPLRGEKLLLKGHGLYQPLLPLASPAGHPGEGGGVHCGAAAGYPNPPCSLIRELTYEEQTSPESDLCSCLNWREHCPPPSFCSAEANCTASSPH